MCSLYIFTLPLFQVHRSIIQVPFFRVQINSNELKMLKGLKKASKTLLFSYSSAHFKFLFAVKLTHFSLITIGLSFFISTKYFNPFVPYLPFSSLPKQ